METGRGCSTREDTVGEPLMVLEIESRTASLVVVGSRGGGGFGYPWMNLIVQNLSLKRPGV